MGEAPVQDEGSAISALGQSPTSLIGRGKDIEFLCAFADGAAVDGSALLLTGDPGVGKTVLLDVTATHAAGSGSRVLRGTGAQFEVNVSYAGLNQIVHPVLDGLSYLPPVQKRALSVALGLEDGAPPDQMVVFNAVLALLFRAASTRPLLIIIDDLPWLDRASAVALGFVARRLTGTRVGLIAAARSGEEGFFDHAGLPGYEVQPLDYAAASALLQDRFPALAPRVRKRLLAEARGNPLALLELPAALTDTQRAASGPAPRVLPLTGKLQAMFASRVGNLPAPTRDVLLLAVLDGTGDLERLAAATSDNALSELLAPAERARLVHIDQITGRLAFRHPLTGSAIVELSTSDQRRNAHRKLAALLADDDERRAWHLAAASSGPDHEVANLLDIAASATLRRGDALGAVCTLLRSAQLSAGGAERSRRLAEAAYLGAAATGDLDAVPHLLEDARRANPDFRGSLAAAVAGSYHLISGSGDVDTAHNLLVGAIEMQQFPYDADDHTLMEALHTLLFVCFSGGRPELWEPFDSALGRVKPQPPEALALLSHTVRDPARSTHAVLGELDSAIADLGGETDPVRIVRLGMAAGFVDRLPGCREALRRVVREGREGGALTLAIDAMFLLANDAFTAGEWDEVTRLADEGISLCDKHGYPVLAWSGVAQKSLVAAARGFDDELRALTDAMIAWAAPRGVRSVQMYAAQAKALGALGRGDFEDAYRHASEVSPGGELSSHVPQALWLILDLVEAAVRTNRHAAAADHVATVVDARVAEISTRLKLITHAAAALAAPDHRAVEMFEKSQSVPNAGRWPFDLARVQLAYGERLRRLKTTSNAREQLRSARETFQRLGARAWAVRAGNELRATGVSIGQVDALGPGSLTPQQLEIARLAATGLTNKEIGERLYLSHRTVGTHLYQLYPKLGITSRAALADALKGVLAQESPGADPE